MTAVLTPLETRTISHAYISKGSNHFLPSLRMHLSSKTILTSTKMKSGNLSTHQKSLPDGQSAFPGSARVLKHSLPGCYLPWSLSGSTLSLPPLPSNLLLQGFSIQTVPEAPEELLQIVLAPPTLELPTQQN